jgi:DNA-binding CsgD family transcriptional regulator
MPIKQTISLVDLQRLDDIIDPSRLREGGDPLPHSVLRDLAALVPCDSAAFVAYDAHTHTSHVEQGFLAYPDEGIAASDEEVLASFWGGFWTWPASLPERTGNHAMIIRDADFSIGRREAGTKDEFHRLMELRHALVAPLPTHGAVSHRIVLWRKDGMDFSDRDVLLLKLIRPHLAEMRDIGYRRRNHDRDLTGRQRELLRLVAGGQTNRQIARHLHIAEGTVRKHLENAYLRLGVTNRTSAVERAFLTSL